jgi:hypothetical protein
VAKCTSAGEGEGAPDGLLVGARGLAGGLVPHDALDVAPHCRRRPFVQLLACSYRSCNS